MDMLVYLFITAVVVVIFMLPTIVAGNRKHHNFLAILVTNLLMGWSGFGWVIALIWACTAVKTNQTLD